MTDTIDMPGDIAAPAPLDKTFDPAAIEAKWYHHWEQAGLFRPERPDAQPFTIVNPPPNVTGSLHIGHALDNTLQDIVVRYERLRGKDALWVVGTDHAGIATQMVVERQLEAQADKRANYSREDFIAKVWEWKQESGGTITGQLRRLGCSMDWSREQFTMDPHFTRAVVKVFVDLYNEDLIYRDKRLVNWDPKLKTAISDLEVETQEIKGHFWHFRYPLADGVTLDSGADHIVVATTRPETMLADMAVAVNAEDPRYQSVIGQFVTLPITGRRIPIVADEHADPALGSGAVKITPGHDFNDFEVGKRAGFTAAAMLNMFDAEANVAQVSDGLIPERFIGLHRFRRDGVDGARELVVAELKASGQLVLHEVKAKDGEVTLAEAEDRVIQTPYGDRGGVVIEPWLTDQWYVNAAKLAKAPMAAVRDGRIEIVPKSWVKTFFNWMENIQPWCVSRQLWWGHRIPAWYGPPIGHDEKSRADDTFAWLEELPNLDDPRARVLATPEVFVAETLNEALAMAKVQYASVGIDFDATNGFRLTTVDGIDEARAAFDNGQLGLWRDPDVLDTWFSSALWPFATLGWPDDQLPSPSGEGLGVGSVPILGAATMAPTPTPPLKGRGLDGTPSLLQRHYPNDLLISGFDILFFWCARMAMQGMHFNHGEVPWKRLYLHGLVRAADGQKMSKSKGNVVDPLLLIDKYGADALRFFMAAMESQGRDVKMDERRVEGYRNFATKLWNAARFCQSNGIGASTSLAAPAATLAVNQWIIGEVALTLAELDRAMAELRFDAAANAIYHFVWDQFCDWYLEFIKGQIDAETQRVAGWVLDQILVMLHPFMPFVTEELWNSLGARESELIVARWPEPGAAVYAEAKAEVEMIIEFTSKVRAAKNELGIAPGTMLVANVSSASTALTSVVSSNSAIVSRLSRISEFSYETPTPGPAFHIGVGADNVILPLDGVIDIAAEKARLTKALEASTKEAKSLQGRLGNPAFVEKAKPEAVEKARADYAGHTVEAERLTAALARLG